MEIRQLLDDLHSSLEHVIAEDELLSMITDRLALLQSIPSHRSLLNPSDLQFVRNVGVISGRLRAFIDLKQELLEVNSLDEYENMVGRLTRIKGALAGLAVAKRVAKEIRELNERVPAIRGNVEVQRHFRRNVRILDLQQNAPRCQRNHRMVIREGRCGYFWGCSQYPFCQARAPLSRNQQQLLTN